MLTLVLRRARAQWRLLLAVLAVVTLGTTLLGVGALLLGTTQDRAFTAAVRQAPPRDVDVTALLVGIKGSETVRLRNDARAVVGQALNRLHPKLTSNVVSRMRRLGGPARLGYLESTDSLSARSKLTSGRWGAAAGEAVVPQTTADRLKLRLGERVTLGQEIGLEPVEKSVTVVVVGTFRPTSRAGWDGDPLAGTGYDAAYSDGSLAKATAAYGPFVVDDATFLATGSTVAALQVTGHPSLGRATDAAMTSTVDALRSADGLLTARAGTRVDISRLASDLPVTLDRVHAQQSATRSMVLVVLLMGTTLALIALLLAGRLLDSVRQTERALLLDLGLGRGQLLAATLLETLLAATTATVVAIPTAALIHSAVTHLPAMKSAGLSQDPTVTVSLVLTEIAGAIVLALALALPVLGRVTPRGRVAVATRYGVDLLLVAVAVAAWWQVHSQPSTSTSGDTTRTLAPLICIAAATVVGVRGASLIVALIARIATRSTALALPLAASQAARRPYAGVALVLLAMATASATFGVALQATWQRSQDDQAAVRVGTDLALAMSTPATDRQAASIVRVTGGSAASAVTDRPLALGRYVGNTGAPPRIVAVDARRASQLLRGRLDDHRTWSGIGHHLAPDRPVTGLRLSSRGVSVQGIAPKGVSATVAPTLVVQDASGFRRTATADAVPLDGRTHRLRGLGDVAGAHLVAARLTLSSPGSRAVGVGTISVALDVAGTGGSTPAWHVRAPGGRDSPLQSSAIRVAPSPGGTTIRATTQVDLQFLSFEDGDLLATTFAPPTVLPVAVSQRLADQIGVKVGGTLSGTVGETVVPLQVAAVIPTVPSEPGNPAVLADADTLSRMLISKDDLEPAVDAWWVADPKPGSAAALRRLDLGEVTSRTEVATQLRQGPLRASIPATLTLLVVAAALLLLAGAALVIGADRPARSAQVARLRALGLERGSARRLVLTEHTILLSVLILTGALVGAVASLALGPSLIRSDVGIAPVPGAVLEWPWVRGVAVVAGGLLGCLIIAAVVTAFAVRRSGVVQLREGD